jgi:hypothetical protein
MHEQVSSTVSTRARALSHPSHTHWARCGFSGRFFLLATWMCSSFGGMDVLFLLAAWMRRNFLKFLNQSNNTDSFDSDSDFDFDFDFSFHHDRLQL